MKTLFTEGQIGGVTVRNRVVMPPMTTRLADGDGGVTDAAIAYYAARARGGAGLITLEMASPEKNGRHRARELGLYDDRFIPGLSRVVAAVHAHGAKASIQIGHAGSRTRQDITGEPPMAPSAFPQTVFDVTTKTVVPEEMSQQRIAQSVAAFGAAAVRAAAAGFDCVELQFAHGYLVSQFLCPFENRRRDGYGGALENRARFALEIVRHIKGCVGLPVIVRFSAETFFPEGASLAEGLVVARWLKEAGADALHVSAGHYRSLPSAAVMIPPMTLPDATFLSQAKAVKEIVGSLPVIAVGRLGNPALAQAVIAEGHGDFVALGRPLLADPDWVRKAMAGEPVRRCIACNTCVNEMRGGATIGCYVNPVTGRELRFDGSARPAMAGSTPRRKKVAVVGAGPAGLSYASLIATRCAVTIFERRGEAGGALRLAGLAPRFQDVEATDVTILAYLAALQETCRRAGVTFHFDADVAARPDLLAGYDRIVVAAGAPYRFGLGRLVEAAIASPFGRSRLMARLFERPAIRDVLYFRARRPSTLQRLLQGAHPTADVFAIGDAFAPGKGQAAIRHAFAKALLDADLPPGGWDSPA